MIIQQRNNIKKQISESLIRKYKGKNEIHVDLPSEDYDWICNSSGLPWLELAIPVPVNTIHQEIKNIEHLLVDHRDEQGEHSGWKSFCIHGKSFDSTREDSHYDNDTEHHFTNQALTLMPNTVTFFKNNFPAAEYRRVRVMLLEPGGYITVHKDDKSNRLSPVNIAITQPSDCHFVMDKHGEIPFCPGKSFMLDVGNLHTVVNNSNKPRYHLIVHSKPNQKFKQMVVTQYNILYNKPL
jgi:hypothetical protein